MDLSAGHSPPASGFFGQWCDPLEARGHLLSRLFSGQVAKRWVPFLKAKFPAKQLP